MSAEIEPREARSLLEEGEAVALDVREPWEWQLGYDVVNLGGGLATWQAQGLPLEPAPGMVA